jgi:Cu/Ag efflux pump CusA
MGGLVTSTFLSRVATPVMYWLLSRGEREPEAASDAVLTAPSPVI